MQKIQNLPLRAYARSLRDVRIVGLLVFGVIALLVSWSGVGVIQSNYDLQKQLLRIDEQNKVLELENSNQQLKNQYFTTDHYLELVARKQFGKAAPGEQMALVPKGVALEHTIDLPNESATEALGQVPQKPAYQRNFEAWMDFFLHRNSK